MSTAIEQPATSRLNPGEYLQLEIARIEILTAMQPQFDLPPENISAEDAESFLATRSQSQQNTLHQIETLIAEKSNRLERLLPIHALSNLYGLGPMERSILLICVAPYLSAVANQYFRVMNGPADHSHASPHILQSLLCPDLADENYNELRRHISAESPLIQKHILRLQHARQATTDLLAPLEVDQRMIDFLLHNDVLDQTLSDFLRRPDWQKYAAEPIDELPLAAPLIEQLKNAALRIQPGDEPALIFFHGPAGAGKTRAVYALARSIDREFLELSMYRLLLGPEPRESMERALREAELRGAFLLVKDCEILSENEARSSQLAHILPAIIQASRVPVLFVSPTLPQLDSLHGGSLQLEFPITPFEIRKHHWESRLNGQGENLKHLTPAILADRFNFTEGQIQRALAVSRNQADLRGPESPLTDEDILFGCRAQSNRALANLASIVPAKFDWDDLVLPAEQLQELRRIQNHLRFREKVYTEWGYEKKIAAGRGLNVMFSGASGTGKTMAASVIAAGLGLELFKIDLSSAVSKYVGETEKNLARIFTEAETANAVLFFDEADALFGKRSEVKDAQDRYANIEVGYLLQRMEDFDGMTILATNMSDNMDKAFLRRLHFIVDFRPPSESERLRLWRMAFPANAPIQSDIDYEFLAKKFPITGADIKNIALGAAFFAVVQDQPINMGHVMTATKTEIVKSGKPFQASDIGEYYNLIEQS